MFHGIFGTLVIPTKLQNLFLITVIIRNISTRNLRYRTLQAIIRIVTLHEMAGHCRVLRKGVTLITGVLMRSFWLLYGE